MSSFYTDNELAKLGLKSYGNNVLISRNSTIYGAGSISLGDNVRVDDFCLLSGNIEIGSYVHISAYSALYGAGGIKIGDFCGVSPRSTIFSASDDFSGEYMISPMVPLELTNVQKDSVVMNNYTQLGASTVIMPGVTIDEGAVTGAMSLVLKNLDAWTINAGIPAQKLKDRSKKVKKLSENING